MEDRLLLQNDDPEAENACNNQENIVLDQNNFSSKNSSLLSHQKEQNYIASHYHEYTDLDSSSDAIVIISETDTDSAISSDQLSTKTTMPKVNICIF